MDFSSQVNCTNTQAENPIIINIPAFNPNNLNTWFIQMQALFSAKRITSQRTKFTYLVEKLPGEIAAEVTDILDPMPEHQPYDTLKEAIIKRIGKSDEAKLRELFNNVQLENRTPSQLLRQMKALLGNHEMSDKVLRRLWLDKLPAYINQILAPMNEDTPLNQLAEFADRIQTVNYPQPSPVHAIKNDKADDRVDKLQAMVEDLSKQIQFLMTQQNPTRGRSNERNYRRSDSRSRSRSRKTYDTCWYHYKFKNEAKRCVFPCNFNKNQGNE